MREPRERGKASHRGHRGHGEGWGWWPKRFGEQRGVPCESHPSGGKHRTEVTEVTERDGVGGQSASVNNEASRARATRAGGKHRTEVTEVTERDGLVAKALR